MFQQAPGRRNSYGKSGGSDSNVHLPLRRGTRRADGDQSADRDEQYYLTTGDQLTDSEMMTGDQQTDSATDSDTDLTDSAIDSDTNLTDSAAGAGDAPAAADGSSSPAQKLLKISQEPIVCQPVE